MATSPEKATNKYAGKSLEELNATMPRDPVEWQQWAEARAALKANQPMSKEAESLARKH